MVQIRVITTNVNRKWHKQIQFLHFHNRALEKKLRAEQKRKGPSVNISIGTAK
jgi:hypothetical protein